MTERYAHVGDRLLEAAAATLDGLGMAGGDGDERDRRAKVELGLEQRPVKSSLVEQAV